MSMRITLGAMPVTELALCGPPKTSIASLMALCLGDSTFRIVMILLRLVTICFVLTGPSFAAIHDLKVLWVSDLHFDPFVDKSLVDELSRSPADSWERVLERAQAKGYSAHGEDANWPLLRSALGAMRETVPHPGLVIVTGDLMCHHFRERFDASATVHTDDAFRHFVRLTMQFLALQINKVSGPEQALVAMGNNDSLCGDYALDMNGPFWGDTLQAAKDWVKPGARDKDFEHDWLHVGSYVVDAFNRRLIVLNDSLWSWKYRDACGQRDNKAPGAVLMSWLQAQVETARQAHKKIWLVYHIPPGIDGFATARNAQGRDPASDPVHFWRADIERDFMTLLGRYRDTIELSLAGHTHLDDFRLIDDGNKVRHLVIMSPALDANARQNPAFRVLLVKQNGTLEDQSTFFLTNLPAAAKGESAGVWAREYSFDDLWRVKKPSFQAYFDMWKAASQPGPSREQWVRVYSVSKPRQSISTADFPYLFCAAARSRDDAYRACVAEQRQRTPEKQRQ